MRAGLFGTFTFLSYFALDSLGVFRWIGDLATPRALPPVVFDAAPATAPSQPPSLAEALAVAPAVTVSPPGDPAPSPPPSTSKRTWLQWAGF